MSLNKPEINYDTALYALQENVVLKQRLEEDKQQYTKRLDVLEALTQQTFNAILCFLLIDFVFSVGIFCQILFGAK